MRASLFADGDGARCAVHALDGAAVFEPEQQPRHRTLRRKAERAPQFLHARHGARAFLMRIDRVKADALAFGEPHHPRKTHDRSATEAAMLAAASITICRRAIRKRGKEGMAETETESENPATPRSMARTKKAVWAGVMSGVLGRAGPVVFRGGSMFEFLLCSRLF